jgi:hypothetical protein
MNTDDVIGAIWFPGGGQTNPPILRWLARVPAVAPASSSYQVTGDRQERPRLRHEDDLGDVTADYVVVPGMGPGVGLMAAIPHACKHFCRDGAHDISANLPVMGKMDRRLLQGRRRSCGALSAQTKPWGVNGISEVPLHQLPEDFDHFSVLEGAIHQRAKLEKPAPVLQRALHGSAPLLGPAAGETI